MFILMILKIIIIDPVGGVSSGEESRHLILSPLGIMSKCRKTDVRVRVLPVN